MYTCSKLRILPPPNPYHLDATAMTYTLLLKVDYKQISHCGRSTVIGYYHPPEAPKRFPAYMAYV